LNKTDLSCFPVIFFFCFTVFEAVLKHFQWDSVGGGVPLEKKTRLAGSQSNHCTAMAKIFTRNEQSLQITVSQSVNNSLPSPLVADSQISSQWTENHSFTCSNLPFTLLHHGYTQWLGYQIWKLKLSDDAHVGSTKTALDRGGMWDGCKSTLVHCVRFHRKPLTLYGLKPAKSSEGIQTKCTLARCCFA